MGKIVEFVRLYLSKYCSESLIKLTAFGCCFDNFEKPLMNVTYFYAIYCFFDEEVVLGRNFPNVKSLKLHDSTSLGFTTFVCNFPNLTRLWFDGMKHYGLCYCELELIEFIRLNPQLEHLELPLKNIEFDQKLTDCIKNYLPKLQHLDLKRISQNQWTSILNNLMEEDW